MSHLLIKTLFISFLLSGVGVIEGMGGTEEANQGSEVLGELIKNSLAKVGELEKFVKAELESTRVRGVELQLAREEVEKKGKEAIVVQLARVKTAEANFARVKAAAAEAALEGEEAAAKAREVASAVAARTDLVKTVALGVGMVAVIGAGIVVIKRKRKVINKKFQELRKRMGLWLN